MRVSDRVGWLVLAVIVAAALVWAVMDPWDYSGLSGAKYEFVEPGCAEVPALCGTPVIVGNAG
jgi:hypothetical protein